MRVAILGSVFFLLAATALAGSAKQPGESQVIATGKAPCGVAFRPSSGSLWVGVYETGMLLQIANGRVASRTRVGATPCRVAVGRTAVWVALDRPGKLVRVSLGSGGRTRVAVGAGAFDVLLAAGSLWAPSFEVGTVARMDPATGRLRRVFKVGGHPTGLAYCGGQIWVGHGRDATWLTSIHPATLRMRRVPLETVDPRRPQCINGDLWVATPDSVLRLDARTGETLRSLRLGETLGDLAAGPDGLVWVTDKQHSRVYRLDPTGSSVVDSFPAGPGAFALSRAGDAMWVTSFAGSDVRSFVP